MGQLPAQRVTPGKPFSSVGVDFAGPVLTKYSHTRRPVIIKTYISVFVCMATKAVHLEPVSDLTAASFLACFRRFVDRRGKPLEVFSDNGGNFAGASRELQEAYALLSNIQTDIQDHCTSLKIIWHFIPERVPHFGGLWEAAVKSMKYHLRRIMGTTRLTFEELTTVLCQIEAILNSRPLVTLDQHNDEGIDSLTPGHFLIGRPLLSLPDKQAAQSMSLHKRWNLCQHLANQFWTRWSRDYLQNMQRRNKWRKEEGNVKIDDIVLIREDSLVALQWPLGRVVQVYPGEDGLVRAASVRTSTSLLKRPVADCAVVQPLRGRGKDFAFGGRNVQG